MRRRSNNNSLTDFLIDYCSVVGIISLVIYALINSSNDTGKVGFFWIFIIVGALIFGCLLFFLSSNKDREKRINNEKADSNKEKPKKVHDKQEMAYKMLHEGVVNSLKEYQQTKKLYGQYLSGIEQKSKQPVGQTPIDPNKKQQLTIRKISNEEFNAKCEAQRKLMEDYQNGLVSHEEFAEQLCKLIGIPFYKSGKKKTGL